MNTTYRHSSYFCPEKYCSENQKITTAEKRNALDKANKILQFLESNDYITQSGVYKNLIEYDIDFNNLVTWKPFVFITKREYLTILSDISQDGKNKGALIGVLCIIRYCMNRTDKDFPQHICLYKTITLAKKIGLHKETCKKYIDELERLGLIRHKVIHIPSANKNRYWNFTLNVPTADEDYQKHLDDAEAFLKERFSKKRKPKDYNDDDE